MSDYLIKFTDPTKEPFVVRAYTTDGPATPNATIPLHPSAVTANTPLILLGKGMFDYGEPIQTDLVHILENFSNSTSPVYSVEGQLWFKNDTQELFVLTDELSGEWNNVIVNHTLTVPLDLNGQRIENIGDATAPQHAINIQTGDARYLGLGGGTLTGPLTLDADPVDPMHAATKQYVVARAGDTMTGYLTLNADPVNPLHAATKQYAVARAGDTMTGPLVISSSSLTITDGSLVLAGTTEMDAGNRPIKNVPTPVDPSDAVPRSYVDAVAAGGLGTAVVGGELVISEPIADPYNGELVLYRDDSTQIPIIGNFAPWPHAHTGGQVTVPFEQDTYGSYIQQQLISSSDFGAPVSMTTAIGLLDQAMSTVSKRNRRFVTPGNGSATVNLPFQYRTEYNTLSVYEDGIKLVANLRGESIQSFPYQQDLSYETELLAAPYAFNINVDGVSYPNRVTDFTGYTLPITLRDVVIAVDNALEAPAHADAQFSPTLVDGTEPSGLIIGEMYQATVTINGVDYPITVFDGEDIPDIATLVFAMNSILATVATVAIVSGAIRVTTRATGATASISITDGAGPSPLPLFSSLSNFSSIPAPVAGSTTATTVYDDGQIHIVSPTSGVGSSVSVAPPSAGTDLFASLGTTGTNIAVSTNYDYSEPGIAFGNATQVVFSATTSPAKTYEFILAPNGLVTPV